MQTLLIADSNEEFQLVLMQSLQGSFRVLCCSNGMEALRLLQQEKPFFLVIDPMLAELDGLTVLEQAVAAGIRPKVLIVSTLLTDYLFSVLHRLGIQYVIRKPCDLKALTARILDISSSTEAIHPLHPDPRKQAAAFLLALGISAKHDGYPYLLEAILMAIEHPQMQITKEVYPAVAKLFQCKIGHVERSMRNALEKGWEKGDKALWLSYFPNLQDRPSNAVFVFHAAAVIRQGLE